MEENQRIHNFDFLRGAFVLLAFVQHLTYYINVWYTNYFQKNDWEDQLYSVHWEYIDKFIPMDDVLYFTALIFTPWVSQIYLTLATFNLSKRDCQDFSSVYGEKLKLFSLLFLFFFFENFLIAPNFGQSISIYPLLTWMIILSLVTLIYRWFNVTGVIVLLALSFMRFLMPTDIGGSFEEWMSIHVHDAFEYDARIQYFLTSGCMGFVFGHLYYHKFKETKLYLLSCASIGLLGLFVWIAFGEPFYVEYVDIMATEHLLIKNLPGTLGILGIQLVVLSFFLIMENEGWRLKNIPIISWTGKYSILVFAFHRVFFVKIWMPMAIFVFALFESRVINNWIHVLTAIIMSVIFAWAIKRTAIFKYITKF